MTLAWRLVKRKHASSAFSGEGARRFGGRWNDRGDAVVYLSDSLALAALELFVHLGVDDLVIPLVSIRVEIPDSLEIERFAQEALPRDWREEPPPASTQAMGSSWLRSKRTVVLCVPSVLVPQQSNYLLDPGHRDFKRTRISAPEPFSFDSRMWKA